jgi:hypothetical protein
MDAFLKLKDEQRRRMCEVAGTSIGLDSPSIEKDFWVCLTLRELFSLTESGPHLTFKGGTSLSKCWALIERFSEDIDVVIDRAFLGFGGGQAPETAPSHKKRDERLDALKVGCQTHIRDVIAPALARRFSEILPADMAWKLVQDPSDKDAQTLLFEYPRMFLSSYIRPVVKIELGARSDTEPSATPSIRPYLAEALPGELGESAFSVRTLDAKRTFWEKASLLHEETYRTGETGPTARLARHYYDLWCLIRAGVADAAMADPDLFARVATHRATFFRKRKEAQESLRPGFLRLLPAFEVRAHWKRDYEAMRETMFFSEPPEFDEILEVVGEFQNTFNRSAEK